MKRSSLYIIVVISICTVLSLSLLSCVEPGDGVEFAGTWYLDNAGETETIVITSSVFSITDSGTIVNGTMDSSITSYDESANHILTEVTAGTGDFVGVPIGTVAYYTYSVSGNELYLAVDPAAYPGTTDTGPYIRQ